MTDSRLQQLKRAWEASGSVEDETAYLRERGRAGDLTEERVELAAYCGHTASRLYLSVKGGAPDRSAREIRSRLIRLGGKPLAMRALLAMAWRDWANPRWVELREEDEALLERHEGLLEANAPPWQSREQEQAMLRSFERWLLDPSEKRLAAALELAGRCGDQRLFRSSAAAAARVLEANSEDALAEAFFRRLSVTPSPRDDTFTLKPDQADELVPWLLGYSDPVAERVAERGQRPSP